MDAWFSPEELTAIALSLAGCSEEMAILEGYGPIDLDPARKLLGNAEELIRLVTHPVTGTVLPGRTPPLTAAW